MKPLKISGQALLLAAASTMPFAANAQTAPDGETEDDDTPRGVDEDIVDADFEDLGKDNR